MFHELSEARPVPFDLYRDFWLKLDQDGGILLVRHQAGAYAERLHERLLEIAEVTVPACISANACDTKIRFATSQMLLELDAARISLPFG
jgi:hypothetical protein